MNFIDAFILAFYFLSSYIYFLKFLINILVDKLSLGLNLYLFWPGTKPGVFGFIGYYSNIFCNLRFYFYKVDTLVFSFIFSEDKKLFFSINKIRKNYV